MKKEKQSDSYSTGYKIFNILGDVFTYLLAIAIVIAALIFAQDSNPQKSILGYRYYTVLTPSMESELSVGDLIIVKLQSADDINLGDIITFNPSSDSEAYLTHRVVEKIDDYEGTGVTCFRTKGDANDTEDSFLIDESRVIGTVQLHIPMLGYVIRFVQLKWYFVIPLVILIIVFFKLVKIYFITGNIKKDEEKDEENQSVPDADS